MKFVLLVQLYNFPQCATIFLNWITISLWRNLAWKGKRRANSKGFSTNANVNELKLMHRFSTILAERFCCTTAEEERGRPAGFQGSSWCSCSNAILRGAEQQQQSCTPTIPPPQIPPSLFEQSKGWHRSECFLSFPHPSLVSLHCRELSQKPNFSSTTTPASWACSRARCCWDLRNPAGFLHVCWGIGLKTTVAFATDSKTKAAYTTTTDEIIHNST